MSKLHSSARYCDNMVAQVRSSRYAHTIKSSRVFFISFDTFAPSRRKYDSRPVKHSGSWISKTRAVCSQPLTDCWETTSSELSRTLSCFVTFSSSTPQAQCIKASSTIELNSFAIRVFKRPFNLASRPLRRSTSITFREKATRIDSSSFVTLSKANNVFAF